MTAPTPAASHLAVVGGTAATAAMQLGVAGFSYIIADDHHSVTLAVSLMLADQLGVAASRFSTANTSPRFWQLVLNRYLRHESSC
ncbi:hypothetical protein [Xanthomonas euvesicatoria]|uniref:hypothetical protein n=1 Tax=Xanthomonas euvesicatoria TaxID=456327 RepID=UPI001E418DBA|nr:hypothetical protein [Xanthomonas euvesicatoria]MCC8801434.1 hypothetical protein [Xanthomonas euvesicatoria pv. euvesicatoria]MCC8810574.1 hypothetical protein [Xanthomonas euvesicatoria pv. euvesicatoria]MCC8819665.1 hypothetical protein [Xanthomonas euvesicatoria pv. euvesicatoria]